MVQCDACGRELHVEARGCTYCGEPRADPAAEHPAPTAPPSLVGVYRPNGGPPEAAASVAASPWAWRAVLAAIVLAVLGGAAVAVSRFWPDSGEVSADVEEAFAGQLDGFGAARQSAPTPSAVIRGNLLAIEAFAPRDGRMAVRELADSPEHWRLSRVHGLLSNDLAAESPDEVGTVAQIRCAERATGQYVRQGPGRPGTPDGLAYQWLCRVELVDVDSGRMIHAQSFTGEQPASETIAGGDRHGLRPDESIADWLDGLPRE